MTRVRRVQGLAAVLATLLAAALATTAQDQAHATTDDVAHAAHKPATTRLRIHVTGCDACSLQLQHAVSGKAHVWTSARQRVGADHVARFKVRTTRTHGLSFVIRAPWQGDTGAVSNVVTRYAGQPIDNRVTRTEARHGKDAEGCWAGTTSPVMRLSFDVARVPAKTLDGHATLLPLAYATHAMSSWKPMVKTFKGTIGNQDAFYCTKPPTSKVTLKAAGCSGCEVQLMNGAIRGENVWVAAPQRVHAGSVTFRVPRPMTRGITGTVVAPWEGATGYTTVIAFRYAGHRVGDAVGFADARAQHRGSPCWGGTASKEVTLTLTTRKVTVPGTTGPAAGTIAFAKVTQPWLRPMMHGHRGVLGSQEVIVCHK
jgi:hypothetical protein